MTHQQALIDTIFGNPNKKIRNIKVTMNYDELAKSLGGVHTPGDFGPFDGTIDWTDSPYTVEERREFIAKTILDFMEAAEDPNRSRRIRSDTDQYGNMLDDGHPDYMPFSERLEHAQNMIGKFPSRDLRSRYEIEMVLEGHILPQDGRTIQDYQDEWEAYQAKRELKGLERHPKQDS